MPVNLVSEDEIRAALFPYRADPGAFEAGVKTRLAAAEKERAADPLASWSPFLRAAAAFLPLELLAGCKAMPATAQVAPTGAAYKVISYLAYPAISMFVLLGATVLSIFKIRGIRNQEIPGVSKEEAFQTAMQMSWPYTLGPVAVFAVTVFLSAIGATWLVFVVYIVSFGLLVQVLSTYAKLGLANRQVIGRFCANGLIFLGIGSQFLGAFGDKEIHYFDQKLIWIVFFGGVWILIQINSFSLADSVRSNQRRRTRQPRALTLLFITGVIFPLVVIPLIPLFILPRPLALRILNPIVWPASPAQIKGYVELFAEARFHSATWHQWEIAAQWAIDAQLNPDLSNPRKLLAEEIAGAQNPFILGSALRIRLLSADQTDELRDYASRRRSLLAAEPRGKGPQAILSLDQQDWVIRAAALRNDLSAEERDRLEQRLLATMEAMSGDRYINLKTALRVTQLLEAIQRPINRDQYREKIYEWLRMFHDPKGRIFLTGGGFKAYLSVPAGTMEPTAHALELMEIYGVPSDLDLNLVRSFLRQKTMDRFSGEQLMAAATLYRLDRLQGIASAKKPTWLEILYYERTLLAAMILVGLCIYATVSAPKARLGYEAPEKAQPSP